MKTDMDMDDDGCSVFQKDRMSLTFLIWDFDVRNVTVGCCAVDRDSVYVIMHYDDAFGATKMFKGEAWAADAVRSYKNRTRAGLEEVVSFFTQMRNVQDGLKAYIVFEGQMSVDKDFDLHLHFDHPVDKKSLLIKDVAKGNNPLSVIDSFGYSSPSLSEADFVNL
jgi:uncharacterized protein YfcZ (UPF0381/DUF406 family)